MFGIFESKSPMTLDEIEAVVRKIWVDRKYRYPPNHTRKEVDEHMLGVHVLAHNYGNDIVDKYHEKNSPNLSKKKSMEILLNPVPDRDEEHFYGMMKEFALLYDPDVYRGIRIVVKMYVKKREEREEKQKNSSKTLWNWLLGGV